MFSQWKDIHTKGLLERADSIDADADSTLVDAIDERLSSENGSVDDKGSAN